MLYEEGKARIHLPKKKGQFFNPKGKLSRDIAVLLTVVESENIGRKLNVLECMAGIGVRTLRYALEGEVSYVWANEGSKDSLELLLKNIQLNSVSERVKPSNEEAKHLMAKFSLMDERFDLVDVDSFGSPSEFTAHAIQSVKLGGIIYITSTDGFTLCGLRKSASMRNYGVYTISSKFCHELGARVVISHFMKVAGNFNFHIEPIISLFDGYSWRIAMRLMKGVEGYFDDFGYVLYNHSTGEYRILKENNLENLNGKWKISGPVWLGRIHDRKFVERMKDKAKTLGYSQAYRILRRISEEIDVPLYYDYTEICDRMEVSTPPRKLILRNLRSMGYLASETHFSHVGIKTDAPLSALKEAIMRSLNML